MAQLSHSLTILSNGEIIEDAQPVIDVPVQYYRKPHDVEIISYDNKDWRYGGDGYRAGRVRGAVLNTPLQKPMPEVYRVSPDHATSLNCGWQRLWRDLNPKLSDDKWSTLLGNKLAWTNGTGFPGHYNCITGDDVGLEFPRFHAPIINGGAVLRGREENGWLWIDGLLTSDPVPSAVDVFTKPWLWFWGTSVNKYGQINLITRLGIDGNYYPVRIPILSRLPLRWPLSYLHKLPPRFMPPDARWMPE